MKRMMILSRKQRIKGLLVEGDNKSLFVLSFDCEEDDATKIRRGQLHGEWIGFNGLQIEPFGGELAGVLNFDTEIEIKDREIRFFR